MLCTHVRAILYSRLGSHFTAPYCLSCSGACPLRSSPVLIRSSGPRDRRESNPRLRSMMNFRSQYLTNCSTIWMAGIWIQMVAQLVKYCDLKFIIDRSRGFDSRQSRGPEDRMTPLAGLIFLSQNKLRKNKKRKNKQVKRYFSR